MFAIAARAGGRIVDVTTHIIAEPRTAETDVTDEHTGLVRSLSGTIPPMLGNLLATLVVLVTLVLGVISLVATWTGNADAFLPLSQMTVAGTVVSLNALYARRTFSYVITLIGAVLWLWVSVTPFEPIWQVVLQAVTATIMAFGLVFSLAAVSLSTKPRF